ncbi:hypothetical protein DSCA_13270 [Desulfosarcina alkanivorans]|uniref:PilZ domain-containing protein n=1 Tax=Desulfosarcina alkanivorans TaxID=571177 RepID=A0A5K7YRX6_9BACT|nr:PilZ domain-containing protein [Desulfosarcina alkanivorans]BBO67397.1 hypothetical protein DSCA_13270 [Desulfosarcina alkanivorans]
MVQNAGIKQRSDTAAGQPAEKTIARVFLNDREEGTFTCPACDRGVIKDLSDFARTRSAIRLKCKCRCGNVYRVLVERRRHFRKPVNLIGMFFFQGSGDRPAKGLIKIRDISQSGIQFSVNSMPEFEIGDKLVIEFTLDDKEHSKIREEGIVQRIQSNIIGLAFKTTDHYGKLGQYLFR